MQEAELSPVLYLADCFLGVLSHAVTQHNETQQVQLSGACLDLLLSHARQVQPVHMSDDSHCSCQQAKALAAVSIHHLQAKTSCDERLCVQFLC